METKENVMNFAIEESQVVNKYFSEYTKKHLTFC
jgi:hypothetical protein